MERAAVLSQSQGNPKDLKHVKIDKMAIYY